MNSYLINFAAYSFAMIGFILTLVFIYKKSVNSSNPISNKQFLQIENSLRISPVKTIYVIKAGCERFLIAGDTATTTMLAKLDDNNSLSQYDIPENINKEIIPFKKLSKFVRG